MNGNIYIICDSGEKIWDNSPSISHGDIKLLPLDASQQDESDEPNFIFLRPLDDELSLKFLKY
ncbi:hypothetical protein RhiirA5_438978 [Rhizophagus irregularis]|uniref:Uncharacterized protein n=1 Tax=Rhizophagus irregularis TaxID=588596 RepID=A0A2N0NIF5_9GLOM|nr:hypothetical protein RhiirA5_438978 [Rhizophagus irregularis]